MEESSTTEEEKEEQQQELRTVQLCIFRLGNTELAIDILQIQEIIKPLEITVVPTTPIFVLGVINLRGTIIPIIRLEHFLQIEDFDESQKGNMIIVRDAKNVVGFDVGKVVEIANALEKDITIYDEAHPLRTENYILGTSRIFNRDVNLMDLHRLLLKAKSLIS